MTAATIPIRVKVSDAWDEVRFDVSPATTLAEIKWRALAVTRVSGDPSAYMLKFRGAEMQDEAATLADSGVVPNAALIVLARRRRPVR